MTLHYSKREGVTTSSWETLAAEASRLRDASVFAGRSGKLRDEREAHEEYRQALIKLQQEIQNNLETFRLY